jgi:hypothetical protein
VGQDHRIDDVSDVLAEGARISPRPPARILGEGVVMRTSRPKTDAQFDFLGISFRPPQQEQEICHLPRATQLPPVTGSPPIEPSMTVSTEPPSICTTVPSPMLPLPRNARSVWKRFLIAGAMSALVVGYLTYGSSHRGSEIALQSPSVPPSIPMSEDVPQPAGLSSVSVEGRAEPDGQANLLQSGAPSRMKPVEIETNAKSSPPPQPIENRPPLDETSALSTPNSVTQVSPALPPHAVLDTQNSQIERKQRIVGNQVSTCYPSASAVRQEHPQAWPSWTMRALGHEGTRCWYPGTRPQPKAPPNDASLGPNE